MRLLTDLGFENPNDVTTSAVSISRSEYDGFQSISAKYGTIFKNRI